MNSLFKIVLYIWLGVSSLTCSKLFAFETSSKFNSKPKFVFDYPVAKIPAGKSVLHIPINIYSKFYYIPKKVNFEIPYFIGKYEVSNKQWNECFKDGGCRAPAIIKESEGDNNPVVRKNWHDAFQFSQWISKKTGYAYRLPTEEEWIYAAYMGKEHKEKEYSFDYTSIDLKKLPEKTTRSIGSINSNAWGMFDFLGNVWEWTLSCWFSSEDKILKKQSIEELNTPEACSVRIVQGESRSHIQDFIFNTYNGGCASLRPAANLGFRLVRENK